MMRVVSGALIRDGKVLMGLRKERGYRPNLWELPPSHLGGTRQAGRQARHLLHLSRRMMATFVWGDGDGPRHDFVDDRDDHRVLIARCGAETWYSRRMTDHWRKPQPSITCLLCLMEEMG